MRREFRLPDVGEGLTEAEIVTWKVKVGDTVRVNDVLVEIETAKSLVELPSPFAGAVDQLLVGEGETVAVGTPIIAVQTAEAGDDPQPTSSVAGPASSPALAAVPALASVPTPDREPVLVGYGPRDAALARRPRRRDPVADLRSPVAGTSAAATVSAVRALAKPPVRKLARDLGVDLATLRPSGAGGIVTRQDVEAAASRTVAPQRVPALVAAGDLDRQTRVPVKGVRRMTAEAMVASAFTAPHVTEWVQVDVTRTMKLVARLRADPEFAGVKVSPLLLVIRAVLLGVRRNPGMNASFETLPDGGAEIVLKHYVNLGIAAATPRGLVVPNIKDADRMGLRELADALMTLTATAREGRTSPADQSGGTITITNVGVFGVDGGTPILNPGEAAIVCFGQVRQLPWVHKGKVRPRWVTQLTVSFDHRLVDGDLGGRFLADVAAVLEDPSRALVWG